jgi:cell division protein FtsX
MEMFKQFWRANYAHVLITSFVVGLFVSVLISIHQTLARAEGSIKASLRVVTFLRDSVSEQEAADLGESIKLQDAELQEVSYTSKQAAMDEAMKDPGLAKSLMLLNSNPLPASFQLRYSDRAWWDRFEPAEKLRGHEAIQEIRWDAQAHALFRSLHGWRLWAMRFSGFVGVILLVWALMGLYRFLLVHGEPRDLGLTLAVGWAGGALAWGLWGLGVRSFQPDLSLFQPFWVWLLPMGMGIVTAQGSFGLEIRHAD